jgi:hypothetical protein
MFCILIATNTNEYMNHTMTAARRCSGTKWTSLATLEASNKAAARATSADCSLFLAIASAMNSPPVIGGYFFAGP